MMTKKQTIEALEMVLGLVQDCDCTQADKMRRCLLTVSFVLAKLVKDIRDNGGRN